VSGSNNDWATPVTEAAASRAAVEWPYFCRSIYCDDDASLGQRVRTFARRFKDGLKDIRGCENFDDQTILLMVVLGIEQSGSHSFEELEAALDISTESGRPVFMSPDDQD
jgi:hypothetical protein